MRSGGELCRDNATVCEVKKQRFEVMSGLEELGGGSSEHGNETRYCHAVEEGAVSSVRSL